MNDTFSFQRFTLLLKKFTKEHVTTYVLYTAAMAGILILVYGLTVLAVLNGRFPQDAPVIYFVLGIIFMSSLFSSSFYGFFANKAKGIQYLNLPSSTAEKITLGFVFTQIVFFTVFIVMFFLVDQLMIKFYNHFHHIPANTSPEYLPMYVGQPLDFNDETVRGGIIVAFVTSAISHYGSLCFEKNAFVKIALIIIILGSGMVFYSHYALKSMVPEETMTGGFFYSTSLRVGDQETVKGIVLLPETWSGFLKWFLPLMLYVLFWSASYFKLKEKQV